MKKLFCLLLLTSNLLLAQSNISLLHVGKFSHEPSGAALSGFSTTNFELAGGMVIVKATLDGQVGDFILDTGSPGIILNSQTDDFQSIQTASGVGGEMEIGTVELKNFEWGIIRKDKMQGFVLDVSHLEAACGRDIMGLIGFEVLKNYELLFDYGNKTVSVYNAGEAGAGRGLRLVQSFSFRLYGHVPVISAKVDGKRVNLGLDSGAGVNLLDKRFFDKIDTAILSDIEQEYLTGLDNERQLVLAADVSATYVKGHCLPEMRYVFTELEQLRQQFGIPLDGLLGFPFFKNQVVSIDYKKKKVSIWQ